ncbi:anti-sigma factor domain-containing protein [Pseudonocardia sp. H11422]|uniref:anti-sigma factor domain-containing protein n=1 Tax=Pseudonocardia sp. H11422 TaxID=2835866 RepID=UPI001BDD9CF7|nr:anti-sigma factor [Pseudonocardia sp. H11422]
MSEQAVGWALQALEPDEELEVVRHLPACPQCQEAVRETEELLSELGAAVEQVEPPARLRDDLLAAAAATRQEPRPSAAKDTTVPSPAARTPGPARHRSGAARPPAASTPPGDRRWLSTRGRKVAAASLALVAVVGIGGLAVRSAQLQAERDAQIAQAQSIFDMVAQFDQPGTRHAWLHTDPAEPPIAAVMVNGDDQKLMTVGLPVNSADRETYVLWGMPAAGPPQVIGTFDVAPASAGPHDVGSAPEVGGFSGYAISIEPGRTAPASPSTVVASGQVET